MAPCFGVIDDVGALQIAVHEAIFVRVCQSVRDLDSVPPRLFDRQRPFTEHVRERPSGQELHHHEQLAVGAPDLVDMADVRMAQPRCVLRFPAQSRLGVFALEGRHLHRDLAAELDVARREHVAHAAAADEPPDLVVHREPGRSPGLRPPAVP